MGIKYRNLEDDVKAMLEGDKDNFLGEVHYLTNTDSNFYSVIRDRTYADLIHFSIDSAIGACTADQCDVIKVSPNYTETITGAGGITCDIDGVDIIGLGNYANQPAFLMDAATTVTCLITASDFRLKNLCFKAGHADIAKFAHVTGKGCTIEGCRIIENTSTENFKVAITGGTADNDFDGLRLLNNIIVMGDGAETGCIDLLKDSSDVQIIGNRLIGDWANSTYAPIYCATAEIPLNILVKGNLIHNKHDGNAAVGVSITGTTATGFVIGNHCQHFDVDGNTAFLGGAAGLYFGENYTSSVGGTASGYLYPAADDGAS